MKNLIKVIPIALMTLAGVATTSCSKLDINTNPVNPVTAPSNLRLPVVLLNMSYHNYAHARFSAYHSFYLTSRYNTSKIESQWNYNDVTRLGAWRWHYFDVGSNARGLYDIAKEEGSYNYMGVAKIMMAYSYLTATDSFGDMPYTEAYTGSFNPKYDSQEQVYEGVATMLAEGLADLDKAGPADKTMDASSDLVFGGDLTKWKAFAKAVKARMLIHTANFKNNYGEVIATVDEALPTFADAQFFFVDGATRDWDRNMWSEKQPNPQWNFADIVNSLNNSMHTDLFMSYLTIDAANKVYDPRLYKLTTPGKYNNYWAAAATLGTSTPTLPTPTDRDNPMDDYANLYNGYWTKEGSPIPYILKEELYFIKAEAAFHSQDLPTAHQAYLDGIRTNLERLGVSATDITGYMMSPKVVQNSGDLKISDIMVQKHIALYLQPETWVDMRRYGYSAQAYPGIYYPVSPLREFGGRWIQRLPYDKQTEYIYNPQEIARLGAEARDWVFTPVWWAERSTLK